jgi:hypothetical protein
VFFITLPSYGANQIQLIGLGELQRVRFAPEDERLTDIGKFQSLFITSHLLFCPGKRIIEPYQ